jgi:hypothetical protein
VFWGGGGVILKLRMHPQSRGICMQQMVQHRLGFGIQENNELYKKLRGLSPQERTIPTERPPLVGEVSANFSG